MPCSSPLWPEPPLSGCLPVTHPADMGTRRAAPLCWAILGLLMLRGQNSQPMTKTSQGNLSNQSLVTEPTSPSTGNRSSPEPGNPNLLLSTSAPAAAHTASHRPWVSNKPGTPRPSSEDAHALSLALTQSQPRKNMSGLAPDLFDGVETSQNATPNATTMSLTILPSPTSETVLTVAAFGVISFIVILVVVVIVLVGVVSLRFKCRKNKDSEDPQKPGSSGLSESCSTANGEKDSITLISMKNINMNNSRGCPSAEKVL